MKKGLLKTTPLPIQPAQTRAPQRSTNLSHSHKDTTLRFLAQPTDVNFGGNVHGGTAMKWLDEAGYVCATGWSGSYCVTVFVGDINFNHPIPVGNLVEIRSKVILTGHTSMHLAVDLYTCNPKVCDTKKAIHCIMVFVAVDPKGNPTPVPKWTPKTPDEISLESYAKRIMELRKLNQKELLSLREKDGNA